MVALFSCDLALSKPCIDDVYNFSIANPILISAANMAGCLPSIVYKEPQAPPPRFEALRAAPEAFEMIREAVLTESGPPHRMPACRIRAGPAIRRMQCIAFGRGTSVALALARARSMGWSTLPLTQALLARLIVAQALLATACECYRMVKARYEQWLRAAQ